MQFPAGFPFRLRVAFTFGLLTLISAGPLHARTGQTAVLPFYVTGRPDALLFEESELPVLLQEALHFYSGELKNISLQPLSETQSALERLNLQSSHLISQEISKKICIETGVSYFMAPYAYFSEKNKIETGATVFSCNTSTSAHQFKNFYTINKLQSGLRAIVRETLPFAPNRTIMKSDSSSRPSDIVVVLDVSGSMVEDIPSVIRGIRSGMREIPPASRLGAVVVQPENQQSVISLDRDWERQLEKLQSFKGQGEVSIQAIDRALAEAEAFRDWKGQKKIMIFTDADTKNARRTSLESRLRRLKSRGMEIQVFHLLSQTPEDRAYWSKITRSLSLADPVVNYARRVGFLEGYSIYLIMRGDRFYRADREIGPAVQNGEDLGVIAPLDTIHYTQMNRNLYKLPEEYARVHRLKVVGKSEIVSGLENKVYRGTTAGQSGSDSKYMALVKSEGHSFWIRHNSESIHRSIAARKNRKYYLGLSYLSTPGTERLPVNDPDRVILREQNNIPRLLINHYSYLMTLPGNVMDPEDLWFFLVETEEVKNVGESRDIR